MKHLFILFLITITGSCFYKPQSTSNTDPYILYGKQVRITTIAQYKQALRECGITYNEKKVDSIYLTKVQKEIK